MLSYDPMPDCTREYIEDEGGNLLFCRDYDDQMFYEICQKAKRLLIQIAEQYAGEVHARIKELGQMVQSIVIANTKVPSVRSSLNLPNRQDLAEARQRILTEATHRTLVGFDNDDNGNFVVVLCFVPPSVRDCDLIIDL
jgi:hypothetical protein